MSDFEKAVKVIKLVVKNCGFYKSDEIDTAIARRVKQIQEDNEALKDWVNEYNRAKKLGFL